MSPQRAGHPVRSIGFACLMALCVILLPPGPASAHTGPPFPIFMDRVVDGHTVSVWADPDIGTASFFVVFEDEDGVGDDPAAEVQVWVRPISERLSRKTYAAVRDASVRNQVQFVAHPEFDQMEKWRVGIVIQPAAAQAIEWITEVEATPDGLSPIYVLLYALPFGILIIFWIAALRRKWRLSHQSH